jgi:hypothetical protein
MPKKHANLSSCPINDAGSFHHLIAGYTHKFLLLLPAPASSAVYLSRLDRIQMVNDGYFEQFTQGILLL